MWYIVIVLQLKCVQLCYGIPFLTSGQYLNLVLELLFDCHSYVHSLVSP